MASASQAFAQSAGAAEGEQGHSPKYKALEESSSRCVATGDDCLRHCFGMLSMNDTKMIDCTKAVYELVAACAALRTLAAVNSPHTPALAKAVADVCVACHKQCEKYPSIPECKACGEACEKCSDRCKKIAA